MKKNFIFRAAGILLVLVLATTCIISGTFAKYTTGATAEATARAAKWGVTINAAGDQTFATQYKNTGNAITVLSSNEDKVVAPGTSGKATFSIDGTPEVTVKVMLAMDANFKEIYLKQGSYIDYTGDGSETFTLAADYYPIKWTLIQTRNETGAVDLPKIVDNGSLSDVKTEIEKYSGASGKQYNPNTNLAATFELSWEWPYETGTTDQEKAIYNAADTLLGNLAASKVCYLADGTTVVPTANYCLETSYQLTISAEQVD